MSDQPDEGTGEELVRSENVSLARRAKKLAIMAGSLGVGAVGGLALTSIVPGALLGVALAGAAGVGLSMSRGVGARLDRGDFDAYERRLSRYIEAKPSGFHREFALVMRAYLVMRRGRLREAQAAFRERAESSTLNAFRRYSELAETACGILAGDEPSAGAALSERPEAGTHLLCAVIAARRGERERVLDIRFALPLFTRLVQGARRSRHEQRGLALVQTCVRADASFVTSRARAEMVAAFPGEFDYLAGNWPELQQVIDDLTLYSTEPPRASARTKRLP